MPNIVEGIINYRGEIFPIINGRRLFGLEWKEYDQDTTVIMVTGEEVDDRLGLVVDQIPEAHLLPVAAMEDFPKRRRLRVETELIECFCREGDRMVIVLDADALLRQIDVTK